MQLYNDVNSDQHCFICTFLGGTSRDVRRHASRMHPDVADSNWPLGDKRHRHAPTGTSYCNTCKVFIGSYNEELHKLNARHRYLCRAMEAASEVMHLAPTMLRQPAPAQVDASVVNANDNTLDVDVMFDGVENSYLLRHDLNVLTRTPLIAAPESGNFFFLGPHSKIVYLSTLTPPQRG